VLGAEAEQWLGVSDPIHDPADHLNSLVHHVAPISNGQIAEAIIADPQAHIDALVAAGVLQRSTARWDYEVYEVVSPKPPHVHEWKFVELHNSVDGILAMWRCTCSETQNTIIEPPS
jgi:hypothetical protein